MDLPAAPYVPRRAARAQTLAVRGLRYHVQRWGRDSGTPLVLLHGFLDTADTYQFLVDAFAGDHPLLAPDWRGFGRTEWAAGGYWFPDYFADLDRLLDALVPGEAVTLIGHSMGGNIASLYAGIRPERVRAVVNLEGFGLARIGPEAAPGRYARWLDEDRDGAAYRTYADPVEFATHLRRRNPHLSAGQAAFLATAATRPTEGGVTVSADPAHRRVNPILYRREETEACWRACVAPVLFLLGGRSAIREAVGPDATAEYLRGLFPVVEVVELPESGHMLHQDAPDACARLIEDFLGRNGALPASRT